MNNRMKDAIRDSLRHGENFFTEETMRWWGSEIVEGMFDNDTFVTVEDNFNKTKRLYTARKYDWNSHDVETISVFQQFDNANDAIRFAKEWSDE